MSVEPVRLTELGLRKGTLTFLMLANELFGCHSVLLQNRELAKPACYIFYCVDDVVVSLCSLSSLCWSYIEHLDSKCPENVAEAATDIWRLSRALDCHAAFQFSSANPKSQAMERFMKPAVELYNIQASLVVHRTIHSKVREPYCGFLTIDMEA